MKLVVNPGHALNGQIDSDLPGDKSISHRGALFAALPQGESRIKNFLISGVTRAMLNALTVLGISWSLEDSTLLVKGRGLTGIGSP